MKTYTSLLLLIAGSLMMASCGKPNDPEVPVITSNYKIAARYATPGFAQDLVMKDSLMYISQGEGGLLLMSVANPESPRFISQLTDEVRGYSSKICLNDSIIYISAGTFGVTVVNVSDVYHPLVTVANLNMKPAKNVYILGNYLLTAISEHGTAIADLTYPEQPDVRGSLTTTGFATGMISSSDTTKLFVTCGEMGLSILDITEFQDGYPESVLLGYCDTPGYAESVVLDEGQSLAYIACGTSGLQIVDYSDLSDVHIVGSILPGGYAKELIFENNKIYLTTEKSGLAIIDVSAPANPKLIETVDTEYALGITTDADYIYVADEVEGLIVISKP